MCTFKVILMLLFYFATMEFERNMWHFWGSSQLHQGRESFKMNRTSWHNSWTTFEHLNHRKHRKMAFNAIWAKIKFRIHDKVTWTSPCTHEGGINSFWYLITFIQTNIMWNHQISKINKSHSQNWNIFIYCESFPTVCQACQFDIIFPYKSNSIWVPNYFWQFVPHLQTLTPFKKWIFLEHKLTFLWLS